METVKHKLIIKKNYINLVFLVIEECSILATRCINNFVD